MSNNTKIDWADKVLNAVYGCKGSCEWCYAKQLHLTRHNAYHSGKNVAKQYALPFDAIQYFEHRLKALYSLKKPSIIFVGSMSDTWGKSVDSEFIKKIINACADNPRQIFMFLTKNPDRYSEFLHLFPKNIMIGATITKMSKYALETLRNFDNWKNEFGVKTFVSIEPILSDFYEIDFRHVDLIIIGKMTGKKNETVIPEREWVDSIKHQNTFYKKNLVKYFPDLTIGNKEQIRNIFNQ